MNLNPQSRDAYKLLHQGVLALANAEQQGFRVNMDYCEKEKEKLTQKIKSIEDEFYDTNFYRRWEHANRGKKVNIYSNPQLSWYLYSIRKIKPKKLTDTGQGSTDEEALKELNIPELDLILEMRRWKKARDTYLDAFIREQVKGYIHPFFNLHLVRTFRSCVAKGTNILVMRDFEEHPQGIPIEQVKNDDYVYCFDDDLNPSIQKVLWAGKTGTKKVIRLHYATRGRRGYLDVTPEHKIRLINGQYVEARKLIGDFRSYRESKHVPKIRALSCSRKNDKLNFTGHLTNGTGVLEHRLIYETFVEKLKNSEVIHHKNHNHFDHRLCNLEKMTKSQHSTYHGENMTDDQHRKIVGALHKNRHKIKYKKGFENAISLKLTRFQCLRKLSKARGQLTKVDTDFDVFKKYLKYHDLDPKQIRLRYNYKGEYFSKGWFLKHHHLGQSKILNLTHINYYNLKKLYQQYELNDKRLWANQFGKFTPGNHVITKIEWINKIVDVYDIEVENYHNFFANEICVHNSSDSPNFQNIPSRDSEVKQIVRGALYPRPGHLLLELDYGQLEVRISSCYNKDPMLLKYNTDPSTDMHADMANQIFKIRYNKNKTGHSHLRKATKNGFVFPEFYGDYYKNCAEALACKWGELPHGVWKKGQGVDFEDGKLSNHLISKKLISLEVFTKHIEKIEKNFWEKRFPVYTQWKENWWESYLESGYIDMLTGFRCSELMEFNDVINYPVQGAAFHCLLWSFIQLERKLREDNLDTKLIGQIHDSIILDVHPEELDYIVATARDITTKQLPKEWDWIIVPLIIEIEKYEKDASWGSKSVLV